MQGQNIGNQFSDFLKSGSMMSVIFIINVAIWLLMLLFPLVDYLFALPVGTSVNGWYNLFALSSDWSIMLHRPWTLFTSMFIHGSFWHILFNMVTLYFSGIMFYRFLGSRRFGWVYFLGGLLGGLLYLFVYNIFPVGQVHTSRLRGASAAVLAVLVAVTAYVPNQEVYLWFVRAFTIKLKWLAIALVIIDLLSIPASNAGGHIAHLGGALFGWLFVVAMRRLQNKPKQRQNSGTRRNQAPRNRNGRPLSDDEYNRRRAEEQRRVDEILDKISRSGYNNLTKEEKEFLFRFK